MVGIDINECLCNNGGCNPHNCVNIDGSFHCECNDGFLLNDSFNCIGMFYPQYSPLIVLHT